MWTHLIAARQWLTQGNMRDYTNCGAMPNIRAENKSDMTPKKKDNFSRVRTTFADCHDAAKLVIRVETWQMWRVSIVPPKIYAEGTYF